ncbi:MAG: M23 family metallopeptidase [Clostridia bacterium]|nr:M23 family metallopeptidase [Clostridia bacterium]
MKAKLLRLSIAMVLIAAIAVLPQTPAFALPDSQEAEFKDIRSYEKWLPASLGIEIPNVNLFAVRDDRPLDEVEIQEAVTFGASRNEAKKMTLSELLDFLGSKKLTPQSKENMRILFPELSKEQIDEMTYKDYENYSYAQTHKALTPDEKTLEELERRGITLDDFIYLHKCYEDDASILAENDAVLRSALKKYYLFKLDYAQAVSNDSDYRNATVPQSEKEDAEPTRYDSSLYETVASFQRYKFNPDSFLRTTYTHIYRHRQNQEVAVLSAYYAIYASSTPDPNPDTYYFTNLYGTFSESHQGAHEGVDMVYSFNGNNTPNVHSITPGTASIPPNDASNGAVKVTHSSYGSAIYAHMTNRIVSGNNTATVSAGAVIGKQGDVGYANGKHVHFEIATSMQPCGNDVLTSASPYLFMHTYNGQHLAPVNDNQWTNYGSPIYHRGACSFLGCSGYAYAYHVPNAAGNRCTVCGYVGTIVGPS